MKKILLPLCGIVIACGLSAHDHPKNILGLRAGYAPSWATSYGVKASMQHGYMIGFSDEVMLSQKVPFYFETGLNFIAKGYRINGYDDSRTTFNYLQLPVGINYHIRVCDNITIEPAAGFYYAIGVGGKRVFGKESAHVFSDGSTSRHDLGYSCGLSATISKFHFGLSYEAGLLNIDKSDLIYGDSSPMIGYKKIKNNSIVFKVGVNF